MMDTSDIAAAALKADGRGTCSCYRHTKNAKPHRSCPKCAGKGIVAACQNCGASGWNPAAGAACTFCEGRGYHLPRREP